MKKYTIEYLDEIIAFRFPEFPQVEDICAAIDEASKIDFRARRLWDFSCGANLTTADAIKIANHANKYKHSPGKIAIVAAKDLAFGLSKVFSAYMEDDTVIVNVFRTEKAAIQWLRGLTSSPLKDPT